MTEDPGTGPFAALLGIRRLEMADGRGRFALTPRPEHMNPHGVVHGGVVYTLVDYAMGAALVSRLGPGERCATLEITIHYLTATTGGELTAEARVVHRSRRIAVLEGRVLGDDGREVARALGSFYVQAPA